MIATFLGDVANHAGHGSKRGLSNHDCKRNSLAVLFCVSVNLRIQDSCGFIHPNLPKLLPELPFPTSPHEALTGCPKGVVVFAQLTYGKPWVSGA